ncbi:hypothetical protein K432DRAFT_385015 [Lepidopterella palustris CBS 459.81]|uniref:Uncharacterized protein n=1 Tax=Lepidopterella palustris CBS 459.81 TaxID=1314670 RepID=A0A8E2E420_9PEZI|nr:hypothetical protein K432DRAFT_385015 [Lepidopterella palustris CBS 459.81]
MNNKHATSSAICVAGFLGCINQCGIYAATVIATDICFAKLRSRSCSFDSLSFSGAGDRIVNV